MKTIRPSSSYKIVVPDNIRERADTRAISFWVDGESLLLQLSSYQRTEGKVISAQMRLQERMEKTPSAWNEVRARLCSDPIVDEAVAEEQKDGLLWVHAYFVWPHLTVYAPISGPPQEVRNPDTWARAALKELSLSVH